MPSLQPDVIVVNGASSAGKSTLCRGLQAAMERPYLCVGFDDFVFMSAPRYYAGADTAAQDVTDDFTRLGVQMVVTSREPLTVRAEFGPVFRHLLDGMAPAVRALVDAGNAVIFDHVLHDVAMARSLRTSLAGLDVPMVGSDVRHHDPRGAREGAGRPRDRSSSRSRRRRPHVLRVRRDGGHRAPAARGVRHCGRGRPRIVQLS